ncbi:MAG: AAA family ATPase [Clostridiales bacterium]|nr:AAA family ATPase [Clostridiales bacterium]
MKIDNFKINNYGKIENREVILKNGINLIKGYNEAGKSTILSFLNSMLYGIDKTKKGNISEYDKYLPWLSTNFSGSMEYSLSDGQKYYVFRDFKKKIPVVLDKNRNDITLNFKQSRKGIDFLDEQIGVDKKTFENTSISYQKLVVLDDKNKAEMAGRLANLVSTGEENFSYEELIKKLNNKQLEEIGSSRTKKRPINNIEERILKLEKEKMEVLNVKDKKERMNEEREETQKQFATIGYIKQMINEIKENFLKKEAEKKIYSEIYNRIEKKKEEIEEKKKERIDVITKEKVFDRIKWIYLVLTLIVIPAAYFYIYSLIVYVLALIVVYIFARNNRDKRMEELEERNRAVEKELNILRKDIIQDERVIQKEKKEFEERFENLKNEMYLKYKNYVNRDYLDRILNKDIEGVFKETSEIEKEYETTMYRLSQINAERNVVESTSGKLTEIVEELEELKQEREKLLNYNDTIEIAKEVLKESYDELKNNVGPEFDKKLSYIVGKITNNKYNDVYIDNEHNIKIKTEHGEYVNLERFSTGTIEQVNLALRLAYIDTISKERLPIILDEAFAFYDDERLANIMRFLSEEYIDRQVIIFTCSNREKKIIDEENIPANIVLI